MSPAIRAAKASARTKAARHRLGAQPEESGKRLDNLSVNVGRGPREGGCQTRDERRARTSAVASMVRRFRRIGSAGVSSARFHDRLAVTGCEGRFADDRAIATASRM